MQGKNGNIWSTVIKNKCLSLATKLSPFAHKTDSLTLARIHISSQLYTPGHPQTPYKTLNSNKSEHISTARTTNRKSFAWMNRSIDSKLNQKGMFPTHTDGNVSFYRKYHHHGPWNCLQFVGFRVSFICSSKELPQGPKINWKTFMFSEEKKPERIFILTSFGISLEK